MANMLSDATGYYVPQNALTFDYPSLQNALAAADESARAQMYGEPGTVGRMARQGLADYADAFKRFFGGDYAKPQTWADMGEQVAYQTPLVGNALSGRDAVNAFRNRDWVGTGLGALGALPLFGMASLPFKYRGRSPELHPGILDIAEKYDAKAAELRRQSMQQYYDDLNKHVYGGAMEPQDIVNVAMADIEGKTRTPKEQEIWDSWLARNRENAVANIRARNDEIDKFLQPKPLPEGDK